MEPATMSLLLSAGGGTMSFLGGLEAAEAAEEAGEYNAQTAEEKARIARWEGNLQVRAQQRTAAKVLGTARATYANSGVQSGEGSALDILQESAANAAFDKIMIETDTNIKVAGLTSQAAISRYEGSVRKTSGQLSAAGSLLTTAGDIYKRMK